MILHDEVDRPRADLGDEFQLIRDGCWRHATGVPSAGFCWDEVLATQIGRGPVMDTGQVVRGVRDFVTILRDGESSGWFRRAMVVGP
jgi:hypothetical protein